MKTLGRFIVVFVAICAFAAWFSNERDAQLARTTSANLASGQYPGGSPAPIARWSYTTDVDPMASGKSHEARIASTNSFEFSFPYAGKQYALLFLRNNPKYGKDVYIRITKGQMICGVSSCSVAVRFDDGAAQNWPASAPKDGDSTFLFLRNYDSFVKQLARAKRVRIQPTVYQQGDVMMEFQVEGFDPAKYSGKS